MVPGRSRPAGTRGAGRHGAPPCPARAPATALLLALPAIAAQVSLAIGSRFEYQRAEIAAGDLVRLLTCHFAHWGPEHLVWDLAAFLILATLAARLSPRGLVVTLAFAATAIPLALWAFLPEIDRYRGLSGLDSALYAFLGVALLRRALASRDRGRAALLALALAAFGAKTAFELSTGTTAFVGSGAFVPVPLAHVVGASVGACVAATGPVVARVLPSPPPLRPVVRGA